MKWEYLVGGVDGEVGDGGGGLVGGGGNGGFLYQSHQKSSSSVVRGCSQVSKLASNGI